MQTIIEWIFTVLSPRLEVLDIVKWRTTHTWEARRHFRWLIELDVWCCLILQRLTLKSVNHKYCKAVRVQVAVLQKDDTQRAVSKVGNFVKLNYHNVKKKLPLVPLNRTALTLLSQFTRKQLLRCYLCLTWLTCLAVIRWGSTRYCLLCNLATKETRQLRLQTPSWITSRAKGEKLLAFRKPLEVNQS